MSRVFQIMVRGRGDEKFARGDFSFGWWESGKEWFWPLEPFSKLKTTCCKHWTLVKIKISMACVYKEYRGKTKMVQEQWLQLKVKILLNYSMKLFISVGGINLWWGDFSWWGRDDWVFGQWGRDSPICPSRENPVAPSSESVKNFKFPIWRSLPEVGENLRSPKAQ